MLTSDFRKLILALGRPLRTPAGPQKQFVALWYRHGRPVMGRAWPEAGRLSASFSNEDKEFSGRSVGGMQLLVQPPSSAAGFVYVWKPLGAALRSDPAAKDCQPVHINFVAPCVVVTREGFELLGGANLKEETAQSSFNGRTLRFAGKEIQHFQVLCRKICHDTIQI